jgi:hypothetical protein
VLCVLAHLTTGHRPIEPFDLDLLHFSHADGSAHS